MCLTVPLPYCVLKERLTETSKWQLHSQGQVLFLATARRTELSTQFPAVYLASQTPIKGCQKGQILVWFIENDRKQIAK